MTASKNQMATRMQQRQLTRQGSRFTEGPVMQYQDEDARSRAVPGDEESAWIKTPPFLTGINPWELAILFPDAANPLTCFTFEEAEVQDFRLITVYFAFTLGDDGGDPLSSAGQLDIVPEARGRDAKNNVAWYTLGVVDPTVSYVQSPCFGDGIGLRQFAPSLLQTPMFTGGPVSPPVRRTVNFNLTWDISVFEAFRLNVLARVTGLESLVHAPALDTYYALAL